MRRACVAALVAAALAAFGAPGVARAADAAPPARAQVVNGGLVDDGQARRLGVVALIAAAEPDPQYGQFCGGALVSRTAVLTAAHCVEGVNPADVDVWSGAATLSPAAGRADVAAVAVHPDYRRDRRGYDVAVVHLAAPADPGVATLPMLPPRFAAATAASPPGFAGPATVWGWGCAAWDADGGSCADYPVTLRQAQVEILDSTSCSTLYRLSSGGSELLCAGATSDTGRAPDACLGDSGGPLTTRGGNGAQLLVAVVTAGYDCGYHPGLYTTAAAHHRWIVRQLAASPAGTVPVTFADAPLFAPHDAGIAATAAAGVAGGHPDGTFRPGNPVTRGQMATFLSRALRLPAGQGTGSSDVDAADVHAATIAAVVASGVSAGYSDGTFRPGVAVTRGQMATFLARGFQLPAGGTVPDDVPAASPHAAGIAATIAAGVAGGYPDGTFRADQPVTRGQMATFLARALLLI